MKVSIIIPVYYNEDNLRPLYAALKEKFIDKIDYDYEIIMVNDGSRDRSYDVICELAGNNPHIVPISLSRNFGSHAACLCGLSNSTGDCAVIKAADLQEPTELILDMIESWKNGNNVVLACREERDEKKSTVGFANLYYWLVRKTSLPNMPKNGFDIYLLDRKAIDVLEGLDEKNSAITGQILWSGFRTGIVYYKRKAREIGTSKWTLKKKIKCFMDMMFVNSGFPINFVGYIGGAISIISVVMIAYFLIKWIVVGESVEGWTSLFILVLFSLGVTMVSLSVLGNYIWRGFEAVKRKPVFIVEDEIKHKD